MSLLVPCSGCGQRTPGKLSSLTWAWWTAANERIAYRQKICFDCYQERVAPLAANAVDQALICPSCGIATVDDMDPVYLTAFLPTIGKLQMEWPTCPSCAVAVRVRAQEGATKLDDRPVGVGAGVQDPGPHTYVDSSPWAALGIRPK